MPCFAASSSTTLEYPSVGWRLGGLLGCGPPNQYHQKGLRATFLGALALDLQRDPEPPPILAPCRGAPPRSVPTTQCAHALHGAPTSKMTKNCFGFQDFLTLRTQDKKYLPFDPPPPFLTTRRERGRPAFTKIGQLRTQNANAPCLTGVLAPK